MFETYEIEGVFHEDDGQPYWDNGALVFPNGEKTAWVQGLRGQHPRHRVQLAGGVGVVGHSLLTSWVPMTEETTFLTPAALAKLEVELEELKTVGRREIEDRIAEARSHGDLRENADYDAAKNDQGLMEARIRKLEHIINTAEVREVEDTGKVEVGSVVTVVDSDGDELEYFVAPQENKVAGLLLASPSSPLGAALIGASVRDDVTYEAPVGEMSVSVKAVRPYDG